MAVTADHSRGLHFDQQLWLCQSCYADHSPGGEVVADKLGHSFYLGQVLETLGHCRRIMGQLDEASRHLRDSIELRDRVGDRFGAARSWRELGFVTFMAGNGRETEAAWRSAYVSHRELGDRQRMLDDYFFLAVLALSQGQWEKAREIATETKAIAVELNSTTFERWPVRALEIAMCMEQDAAQTESGLASFPNSLTKHNARFYFLLFAHSRKGLTNNALMTLDLARTDEEIAVCLPMAARLLAQKGEWQKAAELLALAFRYPPIGDGWVGALPEVAQLREDLAEAISPAELRQSWEQGQTLDIGQVAKKLPQLLTD